MGKSTENQEGTLEYGNEQFKYVKQALNDNYTAAINETRLASTNAIKTLQTNQTAIDTAAMPFTMTATDSMNELRQFLGLSGANGTPALSGDQITSKLEGTPGYKFTVDQGNKAMERTQAAKGLLSSGNALFEAQQFGQGLAQQNYQGHITNLLNLNASAQPMALAALNNKSQTATQIAQLQANKGQQIAGLYTGYGNNMANTYTNKANANFAYAQQQQQNDAIASQNAQAGAGAMAGLQQSGYLGGKF